MNCKIEKNQQGLTLIEIMVAISILVIAYISLMSSFPFGLSINKSAENVTAASLFAQEKIEELVSLDYANIGTGAIEIKHRLSLDSADYLYNYQRKTDVSYVDGNLVDSINDTGMKKISTTIYYVDAISKTEQSYIISTLISER
ncbi:MAG: type II secretion system protein [Patescibacteria group bacterium]